jgi:hypothetical protein
MEETELQQRLTRLAERTAPPPREQLAEAVVARHRAQRRQTIGITALAAVVAAVVLAVPTVLGGSSPAPISATNATVDPSPAVDPFTGPTRGSLAGDTSFVEGVRQLPWTSDDFSSTDTPDAPLETRRVVFAGEVGGARLALVIGENTARPQPPNDDPELQTDLAALSEMALAWFVGPTGATPNQMALATLPHGSAPYGGAAALFDEATGALVIVGAPGDQIAISQRPEVAADGTAGRNFQPVDAPDGVLTLALPAGSTSGQALTYRVTRGVESWTTGPDTVGGADSRPDIPVTWLRPAPAPSPTDTVLTAEPELILGRVGLPPDDVAFSVVWAGDVPAPAETPARVHLLSATLPSGAVFIETLLSLDRGGVVGGSTCGSELRRTGPPLLEQTFVVRCDVTDMSERSDVISSLVVVAPPSAATVRLVDGNGTELSRHPLVDGVAVVPAPDEVSAVETLDADGTSLLWTKPMGNADWGN